MIDKADIDCEAYLDFISEVLNFAISKGTPYRLRLDEFLPTIPNINLCRTKIIKKAVEQMEEDGFLTKSINVDRCFDPADSYNVGDWVKESTAYSWINELRNYRGRPTKEVRQRTTDPLVKLACYLHRRVEDKIFGSAEAEEIPKNQVEKNQQQTGIRVELEALTHPLSSAQVLPGSSSGSIELKTSSKRPRILDLTNCSDASDFSSTADISFSGKSAESAGIDSSDSAPVKKKLCLAGASAAPKGDFVGSMSTLIHNQHNLESANPGRLHQMVVNDVPNAHPLQETTQEQASSATGPQPEAGRNATQLQTRNPSGSKMKIKLGQAAELQNAPDQRMKAFENRDSGSISLNGSGIATLESLAHLQKDLKNLTSRNNALEIELRTLGKEILLLPARMLRHEEQIKSLKAQLSSHEAALQVEKEAALSQKRAHQEELKRKMDAYAKEIKAIKQRGFNDVKTLQQRNNQTLAIIMQRVEHLEQWRILDSRRNLIASSNNAAKTVVGTAQTDHAHPQM